LVQKRSEPNDESPSTSLVSINQESCLKLSIGLV
jgi:hypothetical protein